MSSSLVPGTELQLHLLSVYSVPGTVLGAFLPRDNPIQEAPKSYPRFTQEETEAEEI